MYHVCVYVYMCMYMICMCIRVHTYRCHKRTGGPSTCQARSHTWRRRAPSDAQVCLICLPYVSASCVCLTCPPYMSAFQASSMGRAGIHVLCVCLICLAYMSALCVCLICLAWTGGERHCTHRVYPPQRARRGHQQHTRLEGRL